MEWCHPRLSLYGFDTHGSSTLSPSVNTPTLIHAHVAFVGQACERALSLFSLFKSQSTVFISLCCRCCRSLSCFRAPTALVVDGAFFPASGLPQHLLLWMVCPAVLPCLRAPTALVVDGVSSRSSLLQGFHSACCGCCSQLISLHSSDGVSPLAQLLPVSCVRLLMPSCSICEAAFL